MQAMNFASGCSSWRPPSQPPPLASPGLPCQGTRRHLVAPLASHEDSARACALQRSRASANRARVRARAFHRGMRCAAGPPGLRRHTALEQRNPHDRERRSADDAGDLWRRPTIGTWRVLRTPLQQFMVRHWKDDAPQQRVQLRTVEQVQQRTAGQMVDVPVPLTQERPSHVPMATQQDRHHLVHAEEIVDSHVPREKEAIVHAPQAIPHEQTLQCTTEQIVDASMPLQQEEMVSVPKIVPQAMGVPFTQQDSIRADAVTRMTAAVTRVWEGGASDITEIIVAALESCEELIVEESLQHYVALAAHIISVVVVDVDMRELEEACGLTGV